eukprot:GHRQ01031024.1.p1 GENE.GHRQ01031024.1~~GHRQ01031024.1.p1  ORF type:complete len:129 (-),score=10.76 GHRQ01031024.1:622-1008(-)
MKGLRSALAYASSAYTLSLNTITCGVLGHIRQGFVYHTRQGFVYHIRRRARTPPAEGQLVLLAGRAWAHRAARESVAALRMAGRKAGPELKTATSQATGSVTALRMVGRKAGDLKQAPAEQGPVTALA